MVLVVTRHAGFTAGSSRVSMLVEHSVLLQEHFDFHYAKFIFLAKFNQMSIKILLHMMSEYIDWLYFPWLLCPLFCPIPFVIT